MKRIINEEETSECKYSVMVYVGYKCILIENIDGIDVTRNGIRISKNSYKKDKNFIELINAVKNDIAVRMVVNTLEYYVVITDICCNDDGYLSVAARLAKY